MNPDPALPISGEPSPARFQPLNWRQAALLACGTVVCFHAAYTPAKSGLLALGIIGYLVCLVQLARLKTTRQCFYGGLAVGFACFAPQLECFWRIFGAAAIALWLVLAFWIALFLVLSHLALVRLGPKRAALLLPFLWTGLEYFRSELYYLRFSWLNLSYAFAESSFAAYPLLLLGSYGIGFCLVALACLFMASRRKLGFAAVAFSLALLTWCSFLLAVVAAKGDPKPNLVLASVQLEFPDEKQVLRELNKLVLAQQDLEIRNGKNLRGVTNVDVVVLPEYTLDSEPTAALKDWCSQNQKFLIVGGKEALQGTNYYNTTFVISTNGEVVFKQVKSVPIQFFKDGLPATEQKLWESPWGKIGICICYDLSYTRVTDELVRQGAQLLIVPTMDVAEWGRHQHELHARVAPVRAAEYGIPVFRVASSGISQGVRRSGRVQSSASFPGEAEIIIFGADLSPGLKGSLPLDRWLAPFCVAVTGAFAMWLVLDHYIRRKKHV